MSDTTQLEKNIHFLTVNMSTLYCRGGQRSALWTNTGSDGMSVAFFNTFPTCCKQVSMRAENQSCTCVSGENRPIAEYLQGYPDMPITNVSPPCISTRGAYAGNRHPCNLPFSPSVVFPVAPCSVCWRLWCWQMDLKKMHLFTWVICWWDRIEPLFNRLYEALNIAGRSTQELCDGL